MAAPRELEAILASLAIEGRALEPLRLIGLAEFLETVELTRSAIRRNETMFPVLKTLTDQSASFKGEAAGVRDKVDPSGEVVDNASPELRMLRDRLRKLRSRLRGTLESYLRGKETSRYLQEQIVTDRNGRYVLVVRAEHRASIPGIIHGSSASGASLFLEPLGTVELNNEIVALDEEEAEEVHRILLALTDAFRARALDLQRTVEAATELDLVQARARLSTLMGGTEPVFSSDGGVELRAARHPLLIQALTSRLKDEPSGHRAGVGQADPDGGTAPARTSGGGREDRAHRDGAAVPAEPVPVDILITPPATVLVVTGPNTGGKTVALKTAGLLALMAQSGLHIPAAAGSRLPIFRSVFADIGDEQSISASLSTFSWHVTNIAAMDRTLNLPALVLLDEIGVGTDPVEGGALGMAIIEHLRRRGALVIATTHYDAIKSYASTTAGVVAAAFGFDTATFAPTFALGYGTPGRSLALEVAGRLGLNPAILTAARANLNAREAQLAEHLAKIDEELRQLEHERRLVARERDTLRDEETRMRGREEALRQREETAKRRLDERLDDRLREARTEIDRIVEDLKRRSVELSAQAAERATRQAVPLSTGELGAVRAGAAAALEEVSRRRQGQEDAPRVADPHEDQPAVGDRVAVVSLGLEGTVALIHDGEAEIDVQGKRVRTRLRELRVTARSSPESRAPRASVTVQLQPRPDAGTDLNVIGCSVADALERVERFLDQTLLTEQRTVRFIHGYGTGQLRRAIAQFLQNHPLVARFESAPPEKGGGGVTVVELKE